MIARHWTGTTTKEKAAEYIIHLQTETFEQIKAISGFVSARILKRVVDDGIEFLVITEWETLDAIRKFAGENPDTAVVPPIVQAMMIKYDKLVRHYEVVG